MSGRRIFIVDDDESVLDSLGNYFSMKGYAVSTYNSAIDFLDGYDYDADIQLGCLVSDINMDNMDGIELQTALNAHGFLLPTIFITGHADTNIAIKAMKLGAYDFIEKPFSPPELLKAVEGAIADKKGAIEINKRYLLLSAREKEVLSLIIQGDKNKNIAEKLFISLVTVEAHRAKVMKKMQANSFAELVTMSTLINREGGNNGK